MYRVPSRSPESGGGGSAGRLRRWLLPFAVCAMGGGLALGPAMPALAAGSSAAPDAGSRVATADAGMSGLPGMTLPQQAPGMSVPALPPLPGTASDLPGESGMPDASGVPGMSVPSDPSSAAVSGAPKSHWVPEPWHGSHSSVSVVSTQTLMAHIPAHCGCTPPPPPCPCPPPVHHHPRLHVAKSADHRKAHPGDVVTYTVTFSNTGDAPFRPWRLPVITDHLSGVLQNASYVGGSLSATTGTVAFHPGSATITWTGQLLPGQSGSFSYQVRVRPLGHERWYRALDNVVTAPRSNCPPGTRNAECVVHIPVVPCHHHHHHKKHHKCHKHHRPQPPELAHTGAGGTANAGWAALACLTGGAGLSYGARRVRR